MPPDWQNILEYWFGDAPDDAEVARRQAALWWGGDAHTDALITRRFAALHAQAVAGELRQWEAAPSGRLALIVLADQFSRNMFRGRPQAFAHDALAQRWCLDGLAQGADRALRPIQRVFFYLPLEHAESRPLQQQCLALFEALAAEVPAAQRALFDGYIGYARQHQVIVERFGRFPHRNAVLGRASTDQERAFLQQPGSSF